jgi:phospholipase D1/2
MLRVEASGKNNNFGRKGISWTQKKAPRWCCVRDSYIVALEEPGDVSVANACGPFT